MHPSLKPLAVLLPFALANPAQAIDKHPDADPIIVTATRFSERSIETPSNIMVVTQEDILMSGAQTLPEVLRQIAGLNVMPLYGSIGADTSVDMRGFGEGAGQRTLVLLNGRRLNPLDLSNVDWGQVPLASVDRVEVVSGSSAVLYGDNAVGGVINIITKKHGDAASIETGFGSEGGQMFGASLAKSVGALDLTLSAARRTTDGWRENNRQERDNFSGRLGYHWDRGEVFVDLGWSSLELGLPGALTKAQYLSNPRQAETNDSFAERKTAFVRPGLEFQLGEKLTFAAELGYSEVENTSWVSNWPSFDQRRIRSTSFTPRLRWDHGFGDLKSKTTVGVDYYDGTLNSDRSSANRGPINKTVAIQQYSQAIYAQNLTQLTDRLSVNLGARYQQIEQSASDSTGLRLNNDHDQMIGDVGVSFRVTSGLRLFARTGTTFRYANLDELTTWAGFVSKPVRPERGTFVDLGGQWSTSRYSVKVTAYQLNMKDEIAFNGSENENLAKTRHQGLDTVLNYELSSRWRLNGGLSLQKADFREGANDGKSVPLVPAVRATAGVSFKPDTHWNFSLLANHVGNRYSGGDLANNAFDKLAAYTTYDLAAVWKHRDWTLRGRVANLTDKKYSPVGYYGSYYPADGRAFFADVRYSF